MKKFLVIFCLIISSNAFATELEDLYQKKNALIIRILILSHCEMSLLPIHNKAWKQLMETIKKIREIEERQK